jgi:myosin heavy subunit
MCRGAPESMKKALNLNPDTSKYEYTMHGMQDVPPGLDDVKDFAVMEKSMTVRTIDALASLCCSVQAPQ